MPKIFFSLDKIPHLQFYLHFRRFNWNSCDFLRSCNLLYWFLTLDFKNVSVLTHLIKFHYVLLRLIMYLRLIMSSWSFAFHFCDDQIMCHIDYLFLDDTFAEAKNEIIISLLKEFLFVWCLKKVDLSEIGSQQHSHTYHMLENVLFELYTQTPYTNFSTHNIHKS